jgi:regulatory protein
LQGDLTRKAKQTALRLLSARAYTEKQLRERLIKAGIRTESIDEVIDWLKGLKYIDDKRFAQEWVSLRMQRKGYGPIRLRQELLFKGVDEESINEALESCLDQDQLLKSAQVQAEKQMLRYGDITAEKAYLRVYGFLKRKGFPGRIIKEVLEHLFLPDS